MVAIAVAEWGLEVEGNRPVGIGYGSASHVVNEPSLPGDPRAEGGSGKGIPIEWNMTGVGIERANEMIVVCARTGD